VVELHISNVHAREQVRRHSFVSPAARGIVVGFGVAGHPLAIRGLHDTVRSVVAVQSGYRPRFANQRAQVHQAIAA
jgi:Dehydroquinase class II